MAGGGTSWQQSVASAPKQKLNEELMLQADRESSSQKQCVTDIKKYAPLSAACWENTEKSWQVYWGSF